MPVRASSDPVIIRKLEDGPHCSKSVVLIVDKLVSGGLHIGSGQGINALEGLGGGHAATIG